MAAFEIVLRFPDGREELRLTDVPVALGETLTVLGREWTVVLERDPADVRATAQYLCKLTLEQRGRAEAARKANSEMRKRLARRRERKAG
jgi:hypothetical protein